MKMSGKTLGSLIQIEESKSSSSLRSGNSPREISLGIQKVDSLILKTID